MTNYIPHHTKKQQILKRKELELARLLTRDVPIDKLVAAAETVRDSRIRVLRARRSGLVPNDRSAKMFQKIDHETGTLHDTSALDILREFGWSPAHDGDD